MPETWHYIAHADRIEKIKRWHPKLHDQPFQVRLVIHSECLATSERGRNDAYVQLQATRGTGPEALRRYPRAEPCTIEEALAWLGPSLNEMDVQAVAHGKRLFIFLDGGRRLLKISLNLQGEIMMLPRHNYDTLITNNRHVKRGSAGLAYQIPPEFFNNTRGGSEKSTMFRPMLSLVGRHTVFTVADSNNMCKFKVFVCTTPGDRLTPDDLLWRTKTEYTEFSNILHGTEYGPALHFDGIDVFTRNLRKWRAAVQSSSGSAKKPIVKFISDNNLCFNGFGEWMANDLCAILSMDPRMPIKYFCGVRNNKAWDGLEAWLHKIANEDYVAKFITDCFPISNNVNPLELQSHAYQKFNSMYLLTYYNHRAFLPADQLIAADWTGLMDPNNVQGQRVIEDAPIDMTWISDPNPTKKHVPVRQLISRNTAGKITFSAFTFLKAQAPEKWLGTIEAAYHEGNTEECLPGLVNGPAWRRRKRRAAEDGAEDDEEEEDGAAAAHPLRTFAPTQDWKHKACVGLVDFATSKAVTQLPSDPTPIPTHTSNIAMRGRIQVVRTGSPGRPAKSRKSAAALKKEAHAAEVRHDRMLAGVLASPGLSMEESGSIQQSWNQTLGAKPANFDNILLRPKDRVERLLSRGKHGEEDDDLWGIDWEDGYSDWEDSDREYKWWDE
ncbi:hypothetical protein CALVIDRAFT_567035 [Calocera viscosa TUFC12733]|uniref:Uncharacterized protein n=1 Tax=Calocera viscosa (strain TUFC12733) TaxID=1330018 RepID=A0A167IKD4_CALVF|nr:hypothetical protein CALVIDRAFT_567035 [Calocera viscosa TUFC12733]